MTETAILLLSALLAAQAQPAQSADTSSDTKTEQVAALEDTAVDDEDKIICRRTAVIGSKFKKRICGTKKQWQTLENRSAATTREWQRRGKGLEPNDTNSPGT
ncbi:hypothetical protein [Erythrobacter sp. THAF29]|uniref:hypothetical protein n=1 Tax=Erythrobacter sp. THAF29 TaxID=2587851 RepID=UPI001269357A|nr:hypothetical protein [Erythrobacter sp. THAF29]QFT78940.1 hypothetical protein FIU90_15435 [Erythrobacter sp. THAF29]